MKRTWIFLFQVFLITLVKANDHARSARQNYIDKHKDDAIRDMIRTGVPASITLAQACLESRDGQSRLAREANNHFGIKCSDWKGETIKEDDDEKNECFRKYNSTLESYDDHSLFLRSRPRYASLFLLDITDYKGWAKGLKKAGYATDPKYADHLIRIIEENQLHLLDIQSNAEPIASANEEQVVIPQEKAKKKIYVPSVEPVEAIGERKIYKRNGIEYVIARKGDNLKSLAKEFQLGYWQLPKYNEMDGSDDLYPGQIIYIKPKKSEGSHETYTVKPGDTVLSIAQETGMKSKFIYKYNNIPEGARIEPGQKLVLQK